MSTLTSIFSLNVQPESGQRYATTSTFTDDVLYAYVQEHQITSAENVVIFDMADDPNYSDFVLLRIEVLDFGSGVDGLPIKVTSGSDSCYFYIGRSLPIMEIPSVTLYTAQSNGGSADTIDQIEAIGQATDGWTTALANPVLIRVTAYCVAS